MNRARARRSGPERHLAYDSYEAAVRHIGTPDVDAGMAAAVAHDAALFADALGRLSPARVLAVVATDPPREPYGAAFARAVGLATPSSVRKALTPLLEDDVVVERAGRLMVADPFLAACLRTER